MNKFIILFSASLLFSCQGTNELSDEPFYFTNFDDIAGWVHEENFVYGEARSGNYSIGVNKSREFSLAWKRALVKISKKELKKVRISAYARLIDASDNACIVISIDKGDKNLFWDSIELKEFKLNAKTWTKVESFKEIPAFADEDVFLSIYLWGKGNSSALLDDMEIEFAI